MSTYSSQGGAPIVRIDKKIKRILKGPKVYLLFQWDGANFNDGRKKIFTHACLRIIQAKVLQA